MLFVMAEPAQEQRESDQSVERDHHDREHRISRKCRIVRPVQHRG